MNKLKLSSRLIIFLRILAGTLFLFSAYAKLVSIDHFELYIYSLGYFNLDLSTLLARLLIGGEVFFGLMLIAGLYLRWVAWSSVLIIIAFSIFIFWLWIGASMDHCHCFGELVILTHPQSLLKNAVLILILLPLVRSRKSSWKYRKLLTILVLLISLATPLILSPPDFMRLDYYARKTSFNTSALSQFIQQNQLGQGKHVVCFFGVSCRFCKMAAEKMDIVMEKTTYPETVKYVFMGSQNGIDEFFNETGVRRIPYMKLESSAFLKIIEGRMPLIVLIENGQVKGKYRYRDFRDIEVLNFMDSTESGN